jgi:hypothetical protein
LKQRRLNSQLPSKKIIDAALETACDLKQQRIGFYINPDENCIVMDTIQRVAEDNIGVKAVEIVTTEESLTDPLFQLINRYDLTLGLSLYPAWRRYGNLNSFLKTIIETLEVPEDKVYFIFTLFSKEFAEDILSKKYHLNLLRKGYEVLFIQPVPLKAFGHVLQILPDIIDQADNYLFNQLKLDCSTLGALGLITQCENREMMILPEGVILSHCLYGPEQARSCPAGNQNIAMAATQPSFKLASP